MRYSAGVNAIVGQTMKVGLIATATFALAPIVRAEENDIPRPVHVVSELAQKAFPYEPAAAQKKDETKESDEKVVTMERFTVVESRRSLELERKIESENEKIRAEKFSFVRGGALAKKDIGPFRVELGLFGSVSGISFWKITW